MLRTAVPAQSTCCHPTCSLPGTVSAQLPWNFLWCLPSSPLFREEAAPSVSRAACGDCSAERTQPVLVSTPHPPVRSQKCLICPVTNPNCYLNCTHLLSMLVKVNVNKAIKNRLPALLRLCLVCVIWFLLDKILNEEGAVI